MEQNSKIRVVIEYNGEEKVFRLNKDTQEKEMILKALEKFNLDILEWRQYHLFIYNLKCKASSAEDLESGDKLILKYNQLMDVVMEGNEGLENQTGDESSEKTSLKTQAKEENEIIESESTTESNNSLPDWLNDLENSDSFDEAKSQESRFEEEESKENDNQATTIDLKEIKTQEFADRKELKVEIDKWTYDKKFNLSFETKERE